MSLIYRDVSFICCDVSVINRVAIMVYCYVNFMCRDGIFLYSDTSLIHRFATIVYRDASFICCIVNL